MRDRNLETGNTGVLDTEEKVAGPLDSAETDAGGNFGFSDVASIVALCVSGIASSPISRTTVSSEKKHWVEILLVDQEGTPVPGHAYRIVVPGGAVVEGSLDSKGRGRVDGI